MISSIPHRAVKKIFSNPKRKTYTRPEAIAGIGGAAGVVHANMIDEDAKPEVMTIDKTKYIKDKDWLDKYEKDKAAEVEKDAHNYTFDSLATTKYQRCIKRFNYYWDLDESDKFCDHTVAEET